MAETATRVSKDRLRAHCQRPHNTQNEATAANGGPTTLIRSV